MTNNEQRWIVRFKRGGASDWRCDFLMKVDRRVRWGVFTALQSMSDDEVQGLTEEGIRALSAHGRIGAQTVIGLAEILGVALTSNDEPTKHSLIVLDIAIAHGIGIEKWGDFVAELRRIEAENAGGVEPPEDD